MIVPIEQFPHCDSAVLHKPGDCKYCDEHPDWQELRERWRINFTGETDPEKAPCPSTLRRTAAQVHRWPGNQPTERREEFGQEPQSAWDRLLDDDDPV